MMSFKWWQHKRALYPQINWPGTHYCAEGSAEAKAGGFTFEEFIASNLAAFDGGIYLGGGLSYKHESWVNRYDLVPFGMLNRAIPASKHGASPIELVKWEEGTELAWNQIFHSLSLIPMLPGHDVKYSEETVRSLCWLHNLLV